MGRQHIYEMTMARIYPLYITKVERKNRTKEEVDTIIQWLTGHDAPSFSLVLENEVTLKDFFAEAPQLNPARHLIKGVVCGVRVEEIEEPLMQEIRYMDKLIDELAKGKKMEKILRA